MKTINYIRNYCTANQLFLWCTMLFLGATASNSYGQCPNNNSPYGSIGNLQPGQTGTVYCMYGGEYATVNVTNNATYVFSTCGGSWDSQLTLYTTSGTYLAYNDDACGLQSEIVWTATFTGQVRVMLDRYYCTSYASCMNLNVTRQMNQPAANPCSNSEVLSCGSSSNFTLTSGNGSWEPGGPWGTPGKEQVYSFVAPSTGLYQINMTHSGGGWVDLFIKTGNCNSSGWTYIDDIYTSATNYVSLIQGQTYRFLVDDENTSASSGSISITCPTPAPNPCASIQPLTCGTASSFDLAGAAGSWDPTSGPWGTPGREQVYSYTPPTSGYYDISVTHSGGGYVDLFYQSGSCGGTGWNYVSDIYSSETNSVYLTGGTNYLFLIDDENQNASSGSISISCPCLGSSIDDVITLSSNTTISGSTVNACDDCSLRSSDDITYEIEIPCAGTYTFATCGASWDTYLYLSSQPCSGVLAYNDDNCGLQSSITYDFANAGTYYITVEGFSSISSGNFDLNITRECDMVLKLDPSVYACGNNVSCNGSQDGSIEALVDGGCGNILITWQNGLAGTSISNLAAGTYSAYAQDDFGCSAYKIITLTEPDPMEITSYGDGSVYYGYDPMSCTNIGAIASSGCPNYDYTWSDGSTGEEITVCPEVSTTYYVTATDANGCTASDSVNICVIDVTCYAGNSGHQKVEVCHVPPGNPGNAHTICIDADAVPAHLAHGCSLGSCDEINNCSVSSSFTEPTKINATLEFIPTLHIYPNPATDQLFIDLEFNSDEYVVVTITDAVGKEITQLFEGNLVDNYISLEARINDLSPGIYIIKASGNDFNNISSRFIKK